MHVHYTHKTINLPISPKRNRQKMHNTKSPFIGIVLMILAMLVIPMLDGIAKELSLRYTTTQITWARYFVHFSFMLPFVLIRFGPRAILPKNPRLQLLRSSLLMCSTFMYFWAISLIPLADAIALIFIYPIVVTALSAGILKEQVGFRRWSAVLVGLLGACIVVRPGLLEIGLGTFLALGAGASYGCYLIATRKLANSAPPVITLTFTAFVGTVVFSALVPSYWQTPTNTDLMLMLAMGLLAALGHYMIIKSFEYAEASVLAPYGYSEIIMASLIGYFVFGNFPDLYSWIGISIIIFSGIYISIRERHKRE
jgi:drug/metabolite transporter (DMT)-like permease